MTENNWAEFRSAAGDATLEKDPSSEASASAIISASDESDEFGGFEAADAPQVDGQLSDASAPWLLLAASTTSDSQADPKAQCNEVAGELDSAQVSHAAGEHGDADQMSSGGGLGRSAPTSSAGDSTVSASACTWSEATVRADAELTARCREAEERVAELRQKLREQHNDYERLQERHRKDLDDLRQADRAAVALLVEEHKELLKMSVLQQQELCSVEFQRKLSEELTAVKSMLEDQRHAFELAQADALKKQDEAIRQSLAKVHAELTVQHEESMAAQMRGHEDLLAKAADEERSRTGKAVSAAVDAERERWQALAQQLREEFEPILVKLKDDHLKDVQAELQAERERTKSYWDAWSEESRQSLQQAARAAAEASKCDFDAYLEQRRKAEQGVVQRSLATVDLLIESARQQLSAVMDNYEKNGETRQTHAT